jgi:hypothetical protein
VITLLTAFMLSPYWTPDPGLPTVPPPLPTSIVTDNGTRLECTPNYQQCWLANQ